MAHNDALTVFLIAADGERAETLRALFGSVHLRTRAFPSAAVLLRTLTGARRGCIVADTDGLGMEVPAFQHQLGERDIQLPTLYLARRATVPVAVAAFKAGATDFLERPCNDQTLLDSVHRALEHNRSAVRRREHREAIARCFRQLTPRERDVLEPMVRGWSNRRIAESLGVSEKTVEVYRSRVLRKTGAEKLPDLMRMAIRAGLFEERARCRAQGC